MRVQTIAEHTRGLQLYLLSRVATERLTYILGSGRPRGGPGWGVGRASVVPVRLYASMRADWKVSFVLYSAKNIAAVRLRNGGGICCAKHWSC